MTLFNPPPSADLGAARTDAHYAAQLIAAAGVTLLEPDAHFHFSSTTFDPTRGALVGAPLPGGREVALALATLTLTVGEQSLPLQGQTVSAAATWLGEVLGTPLRFPTWDMPAGSTAEYGPFTASPRELASLAHWFAASHTLLHSFTPGKGNASDIRVWPHHFDIAQLVTLEAHPTDPEASRTVGLGMTPGDAGIPSPYLYVTPWPYPETRATPALPAGRWNVEKWYGAVLEAGSFTGQVEVEAFLRAAFDHAAACAD